MKPIIPRSNLVRASQTLRWRHSGRCSFPAPRRVVWSPEMRHQYFNLHQDFGCVRFLSSSSTNADDFLHLWRDRVAQGKLHPDKAQGKAAKKLQRLQQALLGYSNEEFFRPRPKKPKETKDDDMEKEVAKESKQEAKATQQQSTETKKKEEEEPPLPPLPQVPRGLYIWGPVGTGKSLLMDTFYSVVNVPQKQRFHFHAFMADVHSRIHKLNQQDLQQKGRNFHVDISQDHNPIIRVALQLSKETTLLCLDEMQVTDVADAMILSQLFDVLFLHGTVVVATSNRPPQDLYEGGLNRRYFLPFLDILGRHCIVLSLESTLGDYRKMLSSLEYNKHNNTHTDDEANGSVVLPIPNNNTQFFFQHDSTTNPLGKIVEDLMYQVYSDHDSDNNVLQSFDLKAGFGRTMTVASGDPKGLVGTFSFEELCDGDYGASDYRALAQHFSIIALESVPPLSTFHHNRARRFITLIDEIYEAKCALVCTTEIEMESPDDLFLSLAGQQQKSDIQEGDNSVQVGGETLGIEDVQTEGGQPVSTLASVRELSFAFKRAASRLTEMTSRRWWNQVLHADEWKSADP